MLENLWMQDTPPEASSGHSSCWGRQLCAAFITPSGNSGLSRVVLRQHAACMGGWEGFSHNHVSVRGCSKASVLRTDTLVASQPWLSSSLPSLLTCHPAYIVGAEFKAKTKWSRCPRGHLRLAFLCTLTSHILLPAPPQPENPILVNWNPRLPLEQLWTEFYEKGVRFHIGFCIRL